MSFILAVTDVRKLLAQLVQGRDHLLPTVSNLCMNRSSAVLSRAPLQSLASLETLSIFREKNENNKTLSDEVLSDTKH